MCFYCQIIDANYNPFSFIVSGVYYAQKQTITRKNKHFSCFILSHIRN